jgi:hypothetical protein
VTPLDKAILAAYAASDNSALVDLYAKAATETNDENHAAFYLTNAHVFALETDHPSTDTLRAALIAAGRETALASPNPPRR